ncbi:MAG: hypothetical protein HY332_25770 [Chloroflexi bacterium]|nr:hypothetical protein [Chloroflexota bacterium]
MRRLLLLPVIHQPADLGTIATGMVDRSMALTSPTRWARHERTVQRFWEAATAFLDQLDAARLQLYQDGLPAGGEAGRRVVAEAARRGSHNYRLIQTLLDRGAELCQTEDPALLLREYQLLHQLMDGATLPAAEAQPARAALLAARDEAMAERIVTSLQEGRIGLLLVGADHDVAAYLPADVVVTPLKEPKVVRAYVHSLFAGADDVMEQLATYLGASIDAALE